MGLIDNSIQILIDIGCRRRAVKVAIHTFALAIRDVNVNSCHNAKLIGLIMNGKGQRGSHSTAYKAGRGARSGVQVVFYLRNVVLQLFLYRDALLDLLACVKHSGMVALEAHTDVG